MWDDDDGFCVQVALPGWEAKQVTLDVNDQMLSIKGERPARTVNARHHLEEIGKTFLEMLEVAGICKS